MGRTCYLGRILYRRSLRQPLENPSDPTLHCEHNTDHSQSIWNRVSAACCFQSVGNPSPPSPPIFGQVDQSLITDRVQPNQASPKTSFGTWEHPKDPTHVLIENIQRTIPANSKLRRIVGGTQKLLKSSWKTLKTPQARTHLKPLANN